MTSAHIQKPALEIAMRVLNAYTRRRRPEATDETYLRALTGDTTTPGDELACKIIKAEIRKVRTPNYM